MNKSIALDLHGIINTLPEFFSLLTQALVKDNFEVHVLTGSHIKGQKIEEELQKYGIAYTHLFSISDYHKEKGTEGMWYDEKGDPWVSDTDWDRTKADYCAKNNIAFCIDDTARYAKHFETPFGYMAIQTSNKCPNRYLEYVIDMFKKRSQPKLSLWQKISNWVDKHLGYYLNHPEKQGKEEKNKKYR